MKEIFVIKRNGDKQAFDPDKILNACIASGVSPIDADELAEAINLWVESLRRDTVSSLEIRDRLFIELEKRDKNASGIFAWHQNRKNNQNDKI